MSESPPEEDPRVRLAGERTMLAWVRTGLALMGFGFVVARFGLFLHELAAERGTPPRPGSGLSVVFGAALGVLGVLAIVLASLQHLRFLRALDRGAPYRPPAWSLSIVLAAVLSLIGIGMVAYLILGSL